MNNIPQTVINEARNLIDQYGQCVEYLGEFQNTCYYVFRFPEGTITGFPFVYVYNKKTDDVMGVTGFDALDIIGDFEKN